MVLRHSGASLERGKKITLPPLPLDFDLKTQNRDHPSFKNARVRQGCAPPNPKTPRIWGFHFCHHLRMAKSGGLLSRTYFRVFASCRPRGWHYACLLLVACWDFQGVETAREVGSRNSVSTHLVSPCSIGLVEDCSQDKAGQTFGALRFLAPGLARSR